LQPLSYDGGTFACDRRSESQRMYGRAVDTLWSGRAGRRDIEGLAARAKLGRRACWRRILAAPRDHNGPASGLIAQVFRCVAMRVVDPAREVATSAAASCSRTRGATGVPAAKPHTSC